MAGYASGEDRLELLIGCAFRAGWTRRKARRTFSGLTRLAWTVPLSWSAGPAQETGTRRSYRRGDRSGVDTVRSGSSSG